jgi:lysozyme family protein
MMEFTDAFKKAFDQAMMWEVGGFWNSTDADVVAGKIDTTEQRKKVGFTDIAGDHGGLTKFGIAKNSHPDENIAGLTLQHAMEIYFHDYWLAGKCDKIDSPKIAEFHFDACVNNGIGRAGKFLQAACGAVVDGAVGAGTLALVNAGDEAAILKGMHDNRAAFYEAIVAHDATQGKFMKGWMNRINTVYASLSN